MKILIAEDDPGLCKLLTVTVSKWGHEVIAVGTGTDAWAVLKNGAPSLAILDWMLPGMSGVEICRNVREQTTASPYLILLTALSREEGLIAGLDAGADDYLTKPFEIQELRARLQTAVRIVELQTNLADRVRELEAAIIERKRAEEELRNISLTDDLTGLYNRRGFLTLAKHYVKTTRRTGKDLLLIYCDMDGLKQINDTFGHAEGSLAIKNLSGILRHTFRDSDIVGRLGGDEFAILGAVLPDDASTVTLRLAENLRYHNQQSGRAYRLAVSIGTVCISTAAEIDMDDLMARADARMYAHKRRKKDNELRASVVLEGEQLVTMSVQ